MTYTVINNNSIENLIRAVEEATSADKMITAVKALAAARHPAAIPTLIDVLRYNNPGAAVAAVDGLIELGEAAVQPIIDKLDSYNYGARAWAIRAFAGIGDVRGLDLLMTAAKTDFALSVRRAAARGLGNLKWSGLPTEQIPEAQKQVFNTLKLVCQDPEWVVRYAAIVGLQGLASAVIANPPEWFTEIITQFEEMATTDTEIAVRARALLAKQEISKKQN